MASGILRRFIPLAFIAAVFCGLVYLSVQQSFRMGANDPQIEMAEDAAAKLETSTSTRDIVPPGAVDINESLAPYLIVYDALGNPVAGNGVLDGALPRLPLGVFGNTTRNGEERFTWQPRPGIRQAVVIVKVHGPSSLFSQSSFVMSGRSLREVEIREDQAEFEAFAAWLFAICGLLVLEIIFMLVQTRRQKGAQTS